MPFRILLSLLIHLLLIAQAIPLAHSQEESEPKFIFETGDPAWRGERIELPPGFAPELGWKGVEQIRFAPGMFQPDAEDFFSYVLVFRLDQGADTSEATLEGELLTYFRGLANAVMKGKGKTVETKAFSITLDSEKTVTHAPVQAKQISAFTGALKWVEPFATQQPQTLQFEVHTWQHNGHPVVLSCVSPLSREKAFWKNMRAIRAAFRLEP